MRVNYTHLISAGFIIYSTVFVLWSLMTTYDLVYGIGAQLASYAVTAAVTFLATRFVSPTPAHAWIYGTGWSVIYIALDLILVAPVAGFESLLTSFSLVSYAVILFTPVVVSVIANLRPQQQPV